MNKLALVSFLISINLFNSLFDKRYRPEDCMLCNEQPIDQCFDYEFQYQSYGCCPSIMLTTIGNETNNLTRCDVLFKNMTSAINEMNTEKGKRLLSEFYSAQYIFKDIYKKGREIIDNNFYCKSHLHTSYDSNILTEDDINKFNSGNHCLRFLFKDNLPQPTKEDCFNSILTTETENYGLSCGHYQYEIKLGSGEIMNFNTCLVWKDEIETLKDLEFVNRVIVENTGILAGGNTTDEYIVHISKSKSKTFKFDSTTGEITEDPEHTDEPEQTDEPIHTDGNLSSKYLSLKYIVLFAALII